MDNQIGLFAAITCHYCGMNIGLHPNNCDLMHGFWDGKYNFFVGNCCRNQHYKINPGYYTEVPLTFHQAMQKSKQVNSKVLPASSSTNNQ